MPKIVEIAKLVVDGVDYTDWETVSVTHQLFGQPPYTCRFTCSEGMPLVKNWAKMRIMPGAKCSVYLAGLSAFNNGTVISRQVFVNARRHHIEIQAASLLELSTSAVVHTGSEFKNKTMEQIIRTVVEKVGKKLSIEGGKLPSTIIERYSVTPGISIIDFVDTLTRHFGGAGNSIAHTTNVNGDLVLIVGPIGGSDALVEGQNMLEGREIIYIPWAEATAPKSGNGGSTADTGTQTNQTIAGQRPGNDQKWGAQVASMPFLKQTLSMMGQKMLPQVIVPEIPVFGKEITQGRGFTESNFMMQDYVTVFGTVQGWLNASGTLWKRGEYVTVTSPMLVMNGEKLRIKSVTFSQDNQSGTRTVLELCNERALQQAIPASGQ